MQSITRLTPAAALGLFVQALSEMGRSEIFRPVVAASYGKWSCGEWWRAHSKYLKRLFPLVVMGDDSVLSCSYVNIDFPTDNDHAIVAVILPATVRVTKYHGQSRREQSRGTVGCLEGNGYVN